MPQSWHPSMLASEPLGSTACAWATARYLDLIYENLERARPIARRHMIYTGANTIATRAEPRLT